MFEMLQLLVHGNQNLRQGERDTCEIAAVRTTSYTLDSPTPRRARLPPADNRMTSDWLLVGTIDVGEIPQSRVQGPQLAPRLRWPGEAKCAPRYRPVVQELEARIISSNCSTSPVPGLID